MLIPCQMYSWQIFSHILSVASRLNWLIVFFLPCSTKSHLPIVDPISQAMRVLITNALPVHVWSYSVPLNFSFGNLSVSGFRLRYFIHFEYLMCRQRDKVYPSFIFLHVNTPFSQYYLLKVYFLKSLFDAFIKKQVFAIVFPCILVFCSIPSMCLLLSEYYGSVV